MGPCHRSRGSGPTPVQLNLNVSLVFVKTKLFFRGGGGAQGADSIFYFLGTGCRLNFCKAAVLKFDRVIKLVNINN